MDCPRCGYWRASKQWSKVQWNANDGKGSPYVFDANGWPQNCCKTCCGSDGTYYRLPDPAPSQSSSSNQGQDGASSQGRQDGASSQCRQDGASSQGRRERASSRGFVFSQDDIDIDPEIIYVEAPPKRRRSEAELEDRERMANPLRPPSGARCPITREEAQRNWDSAAGILGELVPNEF